MIKLDFFFFIDIRITDLEKNAADMLGKEAALFVTSGTMGNLIARKIHMDFE